MSRLLAVSWNANVLRYISANADKRSQLQILDVGHEVLDNPSASGVGSVGSNPGAGGNAAVVAAVRQLVTRLKAEKSRLLILLNRSSVDSAALTVPPATDAELPGLIQNLAQQSIPGSTDETLLDFIAYPAAADGTRTVRAMALLADDQQLVRQLMQQSGCRDQRVLVGTHPLRAYLSADARQRSELTSLVVVRGEDAADIILFSGELPVLSRTIRLATGIPADEITRYLTSETQRTLISAGGHLAEALQVDSVTVVGNTQQTLGLDIALSHHFDCDSVVEEPASLLEAAQRSQLSQQIAERLESGTFAGLLAALKEEAGDIRPVVDFANPKRPPVQQNQVKRWLAISTVAALVIGGGWYYVWSQFAAIDAENAQLAIRLNELDDLVRETQPKRRLAASLSAWEKNRFSWPDELRDLTNRIPASPDLVVQQLSISPAGAGRATVTFRGTGRQPEMIQQLESNLRDSYHQLRIPGIREQQEGGKTVWTFQTTMTVQSRTREQYATATASGAGRQNSEAAGKQRAVSK